MSAAVFLDRDNTVIANEGDLGDPDRVELMHGAGSAIASLRGLGYRIVLVTNQGGVARGAFAEADVDAVHERINELVRKAANTWIDRFYYCPYHPEATVEAYRGDHPWRKPRPGMLEQAASDLSLDLRQSWMIGDQLRDVEAGLAAGVRTILLDPEAPEVPAVGEGRSVEAIAEAREASDAGDAVRPHFRARRLIEAVRIVAQQRRPEVEQDPSVTHVETAPGPGPRRTGRPFRPMELAPPDAEAGATPAPDRAAQVRADRSSGPRPPVAAPAAAAAEAPPTGAADTGEAPSPEPATAEAVPEAAAAESDPAPAESPGGGARSAADDGTRRERLLGQILQELREQRLHGREMSHLDLAALLLQFGAGLCLAGALVMASDPGLFARWLGVGILLELATIAVLLFRR